MTLEEFNQNIRRFDALGEHHEAFKFCLGCLSEPEIKWEAVAVAKMLIKNYGNLVMQKDGGNRILLLRIDLKQTWIVDTAISLGYNTLEKGKISTGLFSSVPSIEIGSMLSKQKFGVKNFKDGSTTFYYSYGSFAKDFKLLDALLVDIVDKMAEMGN